MMNTLKNHKQLCIRIILILLIALQLGNIIYCFTVKKKGLHSDEAFSYGLANSYYQPFITSADHTSTEALNKNQWLSGEVFDDYLTVNEDERFAYGSVYYNNTKDVHPPFYYFVLHTVCSLFPGTFSWWYGFSINIVLFILTQLLLYKISRRVTGSTFLSLLVCFLYGFSQGCINTFIFIRMYSMITFFGVLSIYLHLKLLDNEKYKRNLCLIACVTFIGSLTHYYFLVFEFLLSGCMCIYYLFKKQFKKMFIYGGTQLLAALLSFAFYPYIYQHMLTFGGDYSTNSNYAGFWVELRYFKSFLINELFGIYIMPRPSYLLIYLAEFMLYAVIIITPIAILFRKEIWFRKTLSYIWGIIKDLCVRLKNVNIIVYFCIVITVLEFLVICRTATIIIFGHTATRYMFLTYPYIYLIVIVAANLILELITSFIRNKRYVIVAVRSIMCIMTAVLLTVIYVYSPKDFYRDESEQQTVSVSKLDRNANYIIVIKQDWVINYMSASLLGIDNFFYSTTNDFLNQRESLSSTQDIDTDKKTYFIIEKAYFNDVAEYESEDSSYEWSEFIEKNNELYAYDSDLSTEYLNEYKEFLYENGIASKFEYAGCDVLFGRAVYVFEIN
jgi:hypothetical protein